MVVEFLRLTNPLIMKSRFLLLAFFCLSFSSVVSGAVLENNVRNQMFADVDVKHENYNAIYYLKNTGVVQGYDVKDSVVANYNPDKSINRAEFLKMIIEGNDIAVESDYKSCFPDVGDDVWFTNYVCKAKEEGWINGYADGKFRPEQTINEVEALKIMGEILEWEKPKLSAEAEWYDYYLNPAEEKKIVPKDDIGSKMTRGDIAELVFRNTMVSELGVPYYDEKWEANLFAEEEIPLSGPLGPGGLFGPGGPMGPSGAFIENGVFDSEKGGAKLVPESFFKDNFCYFSDEGEFSGDNLEFLKDFTQTDLDKYVEGSIMDEFGQMFCYSGIAATNLMLFDEKMREDFDILCWTEPGFKTMEKDGWDEILCWAREKDKPELLNIGNESPLVQIEVVETGDIAVDYNASAVEILKLKIKTLSEKEEGVGGVDLQNYGESDPYNIEHISVKDGNGVSYFESTIYMFDWQKEILKIYFDKPLMLQPGEETVLSVYADLDWEDYDGDLQIGLWNAVLLNEAISVIGESIVGAVIGLEKELVVEDLDEPLCYLSPDGKRTIGSENEPPDKVEVNEGMHLVTPITQKGDTCAAAASYSSLRWLEEKLGIDNFVRNGQEGYDALIKMLYEDTWTLTGQYKLFKKYINESFPGCLKADYHTNDWGGSNLTCAELKGYYDHGCDIPLGLRCTNPGDFFSWGHRVDIVDVAIDAANPNKCQIIFANSQTPDAGETAGPDDPDGLGYGSYQRADYYDNENKFDIKAPWGKGLPCTLYGAMYVCVEDEEVCRKNDSIIDFSDPDDIDLSDPDNIILPEETK